MRFAKDKLKEIGEARIRASQEARKEIDPYDLGYDFPFPDKDIEQLSRIAEQITASKRESMTYENIRNNGLEYMNAQIATQLESDFVPPGSALSNDDDLNDLDLIGF